MTTATLRTAAASAYAAPDRAGLNAECLRCILEGRPFPEGIRLPVERPLRPQTVEEGTRWVLGEMRLAVI